MFVFRKMSLLFFLSQSAMNLPLLNIAIILMNKIKFSRKLINFINKYERKKGKIHKICKFFYRNKLYRSSESNPDANLY